MVKVIRTELVRDYIEDSADGVCFDSNSQPPQTIQKTFKDPTVLIPKKMDLGVSKQRKGLKK